MMFFYQAVKSNIISQFAIKKSCNSIWRCCCSQKFLSRFQIFDIQSILIFIHTEGRIIRSSFLWEFFIHWVKLKTPANKKFYWKSTFSSPAPLLGMYELPVIGTSTAVQIIHLLLSSYSQTFFQNLHSFFLRKSMKQEDHLGRKQGKILMPSKNPERNIRFFTGVFYFP